MPTKIKDTIGTAANRAQQNAAKRVQRYQSKIGEDPNVLFDPTEDAEVARELARGIKLKRARFRTIVNQYLSTANPSKDFEYAIEGTYKVLEQALTSAQTAIVKRGAKLKDFGGGTARGLGGPARGLKFSRGLNPERQLIAVTEQRLSIQKDIRNIEDTIEALKGQEVKIDDSKLSKLKEQEKVYIEQAASIKEQIAQTKKLQTMGGGSIVGGARAGMRVGGPFGPVGQILGAGMGGVVGGVGRMMGMLGNIPIGQAIEFAKVLPSVLSREGRNRAYALEGKTPTWGGLYGTSNSIPAAWRLAGMRNAGGGGGGSVVEGVAIAEMAANPWVAGAYLGARIIGAGYGLAKSGLEYQKKGAMTAFGFGMGNRKGLDQFQSSTGVSLGIGGGLGGYSGAVGKELFRLGIGPNEALDLASTYGAFNSKGQIPLVDLARATRGNFLAGVGPEGLSQAGRWGTRALGMDPDKLFPVLAGAVEKGMKSGMTAPEVVQTIVSMSKAMAVGTGVGMASAGGMYGIFNNLKGKVAEFMTPEGMSRAAGELATSGSQAVGSPFGFALLNKAIMDMPGKTYEEKFGGVMPKGMFARMKAGLLSNDKKLLQSLPNFLSTQAIFKSDLLGPFAAFMEAQAVERLTKNYPMQFGMLTGIGMSPSLARTMLNNPSAKGLMEAGMGISQPDKDSMALGNIDDTTKDMLNVLKLLAVPEITSLWGKTIAANLATDAGIGMGILAGPPASGPAERDWRARRLSAFTGGGHWGLTGFDALGESEYTWMDSRGKPIRGGGGHKPVVLSLP